MDRVGVVLLTIAIALSLLQRAPEPSVTVELKNIDHSTTAGFNIAALLITLISIALYTIWW